MRRRSISNTGSFTFYRAGRNARDGGKLLTDCPQEQQCGADIRGMIRMKAWADGWTSRDQEIREPRMAMKGAD